MKNMKMHLLIKNYKLNRSTGFFIRVLLLSFGASWVSEEFLDNLWTQVIQNKCPHVSSFGFNMGFLHIVHIVLL